MWYNLTMEFCNCCPRHCLADRVKTAGYCGEYGLKVARASLHFWEEPPISGTRGSGTVFFSGCNLKCVYCQNYDISRGKGTLLTPRQLADVFKRLEDAGAHNINLVTASHFTDGITEAFEIYRPALPVVYNCGGYESVDNLKRLEGIVDIYLPDFKYADNALAEKYSNAPDYAERCTLALSEMRRQQPQDIFDDGIMQKGMIIRHLVLPDAVDNTKRVLEWIKCNLSSDTYISVMGQYIPCGQAKEYPPLDRKLKPLEYKIALSYAEKLGFVNAFVQDEESADEAFVPDFDVSPVALK